MEFRAREQKKGWKTQHERQSSCGMDDFLRKSSMPQALEEQAQLRALQAWVESPNNSLPGRAAQACHSPNACMHALNSP